MSGVGASVGQAAAQNSPVNQVGAVHPAVLSGLTDVSVLTPAEQSNISLLMDVYMEMTVEL